MNIKSGKNIILNILIYITFFSFIAVAQTPQKKSVIRQEGDKNLTPYQQLKGDTLLKPIPKSDDTYLPGKLGMTYTSSQDSAYYKAMRLRIPSASRFANDLRRFETTWKIQQEVYRETPEEMIKRAMALPPEFFKASDVEVAMYQENLIRSQYVPFINTMPQYGFKATFAAIGRFFGITEDLSPTIKYTIDFPQDVEVVIYSVQAVVIATIFKGTQNPGKYTITWNLRDASGKKMPNGDYIAEVRMSNDKFFRKRIKIPWQ